MATFGNLDAFYIVETTPQTPYYTTRSERAARKLARQMVQERLVESARVIAARLTSDERQIIYRA